MHIARGLDHVLLKLVRYNRAGLFLPEAGFQSVALKCVWNEVRFHAADYATDKVFRELTRILFGWDAILRELRSDREPEGERR